MRHRLQSTALSFGWTLAVLWLGCAAVRAQAATLKLEVQLVWGTTNATSPDPKHRPVEAEVREKLKELPLKWSNYFEVTRQSLVMPPSSLSKVSLSEKCQIEVKSLGGSKVAVTLFGKGKETWRGTQTLPRGELLVLGGNAPNATSWLVVLKRLE